MIQVLNAIYGGERFSRDGVNLIDHGAHLPGFALDKTGKLRASGAEISGHIEADSGTFSGNVELNMAQYGNVRYPLLGGLRAFARGRRMGNGNFHWTLSDNVVAVNRVSVGHFEVIVSADNLINQEQIARAYESWDNLSPFWYRNPMRAEFNHGRLVSQNPFRFHIEFQFRRAANNALADPVIADIYWMG